MHMTKEEFQEQLKSSLDGVDDMPPLEYLGPAGGPSASPLPTGSKATAPASLR